MTLVHCSLVNCDNGVVSGAEKFLHIDDVVMTNEDITNEAVITAATSVANDGKQKTLQIVYTKTPQE